jgi:putative flippase GtrA
MRALILEFGGYGAASFAALALDVGLLTLLVNVAGWHYLLAAAASFVAGGLLLYVLSVMFVFRFRRIENRVLELSYFVGLGVAGFIVNMAVMYAAVEGLGMYFLIAKMCAAACTCGTNFLLRRQLLFSRSF